MTGPPRAGQADERSIRPDRDPRADRAADDQVERREGPPEQGQAVSPSPSASSTTNDLLAFNVGDVITVLDKREADGMWFGCLDPGGRAGLFSPGSTVAYIGALPAQAGNTRWQQEEVYQSTNT